jgi:hypothetical protein
MGSICTEAAELWMPSDVSLEKIVVKWNKTIGFEIVSHNQNSPAIASVQKQLEFFARQSGLNVSPASNTTADFAIVIVPDIVAVGPKVREFVERYFTEISPGGRLRINPEGLLRTLASTPLKCSGLDLYVNGRIERAFRLLQEDQPEVCFAVGLGELFGLINIRRLYFENREYSSTEYISAALRSLYTDTIKSGMTSTVAKMNLRGACK